MNLRPFITGSHAYGIPHDKSDVDLVVFLTEKELKILLREALAAEEDIQKAYLENTESKGLRFGNLNLLVVTNEENYNIWWKGTRELKAMAPVTRAFAVEYFARLRKEDIANHLASI